MRSPSRIVGIIGPVGTSFQSAKDERMAQTTSRRIRIGRMKFQKRMAGEGGGPSSSASSAFALDLALSAVGSVAIKNSRQGLISEPRKRSAARRGETKDSGIVKSNRNLDRYQTPVSMIIATERPFVLGLSIAPSSRKLTGFHQRTTHDPLATTYADSQFLDHRP